MTFYGQTEFFSWAVFRKDLKFSNNRATTFETARLLGYAANILSISLLVEVFKTLQVRI